MSSEGKFNLDHSRLKIDVYSSQASSMLSQYFYGIFWFFARCHDVLIANSL
jgi:hypothetical protein